MLSLHCDVLPNIHTVFINATAACDYFTLLVLTFGPSIWWKTSWYPAGCLLSLFLVYLDEYKRRRRDVNPNLTWQCSAFEDDNVMTLIWRYDSCGSSKKHCWLYTLIYKNTLSLLGTIHIYTYLFILKFSLISLILTPLIFIGKFTHIILYIYCLLIFNIRDFGSLQWIA